VADQPNSPTDPKPEAPASSTPAPPAGPKITTSADGSVPTAIPEAVELSNTGEKGEPRVKVRSWRKVRKNALFLPLLIVIIFFILIIAGGVGWYIYNNKKNASKLTKQEIPTQNVNPGFDSAAEKQVSLGTGDSVLNIQGKSDFKGKTLFESDATVNGALTVVGASTLSTLNVTGNSTLANAEVKSNLTVDGVTTLQGAVSFKSLLTAAAGLNVVGNTSLGGSVSASSLTVTGNTSTGSLNVNGHVVSGGPGPSVGVTGNAGPAGTASISGNDFAGTVSIGVGVGGAAGILANINFHSSFGATPHVILSPVGSPSGTLEYYVNRSPGGFSIGTANTPPPGSYSYDFIVVQ